MNKTQLKPGDIICIVNQEWVGCLAVVDEVKNWGATVDITVPTGPRNVGIVPMRLEWDQMIKVGEMPKGDE